MTTKKPVLVLVVFFIFMGSAFAQTPDCKLLVKDAVEARQASDPELTRLLESVGQRIIPLTKGQADGFVKKALDCTDNSAQIQKLLTEQTDLKQKLVKVEADLVRLRAGQATTVVIPTTPGKNLFFVCWGGGASKGCRYGEPFVTRRLAEDSFENDPVGQVYRVDVLDSEVAKAKAKQSIPNTVYVLCWDRAGSEGCNYGQTYDSLEEGRKDNEDESSKRGGYFVKTLIVPTARLSVSK